ncbi:MAG: hypothetical protein R2851_26895 [Caldilineaceae bacterium]
MPSSTLKGFLLFVAGVLVVCAGLGMQVLLSAQIRQAEVEKCAARPGGADRATEH